MKPTFDFFYRSLLILCIGMTGSVACTSAPDEPTAPATLRITDVTPGEDRVSFRLNPTNAASMAYKVEPSNAIGTGSFVAIKNGEAQSIEVTELTPATAYTLTALAFNADHTPSPETVEHFTTLSPAAPRVEISDVTATHRSVTFTVCTENALRFGYKVDQPEGDAPLTFVRNAEEGTYTVEELEADTDYIITVVAYNAEDEAQEPVTQTVRTAPLPSEPATVEISNVEVGHSSIRFTVEAENAVRIAYEVTPRKTDDGPQLIEYTGPTTLVVTGLQPEHDYTLKINAYNGQNTPSEPVIHTFRPAVYAAFAEITVGASAHGIHVDCTVDSERFPLYVLKIFDPAAPEVSADFSEQFRVDSKEQFLHFLEVASLNAWLHEGSFSEWNQTMLSTESKEVTLYAAPVERIGTQIICPDPGEILEIPITLPDTDTIGAGTATVTLGDPQVEGQAMNVSLSASEEAVAWLTAIATANEVEAVGSVEEYVQQQLDGGAFDFEIHSTQQMPATWEVDLLAIGSEYYLFSLAYDKSGKLGALQWREFAIEGSLNYDPALTVDVSVKELGFTSATFTITRHGFKNGRYSHIKKADFVSKYNNNADTYIRQEMIADGKYPSTFYQDGDLKCSYPKPEYDTEYVLILLPEADDKSGYGTPSVIEFKTLGYEATGTASLSVTVDQIEDYYGMYYPHVTVTPDADCTGYYYLLMTQSEYEAAADTLGETVCQSKSLTYRSADEAQSFKVSRWFDTNSYLVLIPVDGQGRFSEPVTSELLTPPAQ